MGLRMDLGGSVRVVHPLEQPEMFAPLVALYQRKVGGAASRPTRRSAGSRAAPPSPPRSCWRRARRTPPSSAAPATGCAIGSTPWPASASAPEVSRAYALSALITGGATLFFVDTHLLLDPTAKQLAEMTLLAAEEVRGFGIVPKVALLSHSSFGSSGAPVARKMREALALIRAAAPELEVDGEMHGDAALVPAIRARAVPDPALEGMANLLVFPGIDAANISYNLVKAVSDGLQVGPMLLGMNKPIHVLVPSVTARGIANLAAVAGAQVGRDAG
jgi:malate dehydrogenase (oxaloacetate-decarboxylating)(NADP+)